MYNNTILMNEFQFKSNNKANSWIGIIVVIAVVLIVFLVIKNLYDLLWTLIPVFLILTAILDYRVLAKFGIVIYELLRFRTLLGIIAVVFTLAGLPFVAAALFFNAFMNFKTKRKNKKGFTKFEEIKDTGNEIFSTKEPKVEDKFSDYEELFD